MENKSTGSPASAHERPWLNTSLSPDERAALVLAQLTLEEKIGMVHGRSNDAYAMAAIARLGIPALTMTDGPAGITAGRATALPAPIGLAPGETREVTVTLDPKASSHPLSYWDVKTNGWEIAGGHYQVYLGASSRDIRLIGTLRVHHSPRE